MGHLLLTQTFPITNCSSLNSGDRVKLACVNWYGFQLEDLVINGLDRQPLDKIAGRIAELGFNCVRLVYALDVFYENPVGHCCRFSIQEFLQNDKLCCRFDWIRRIM